MNVTLKNTPLSQRQVDLKSWLIALFVALSFLVKFITVLLGSYFLFAMALLATGFLLVLFIPLQLKKGITFAFLWWLSYLYILLSHSGKRQYFSDYLTLFVFFAGIALLLCSGGESRNFQPACKVIFVLSLFYAASVWLQVLFPSLYNLYLTRLPLSNQTAILAASQDQAYYTGFSSNAGFTAGHLISGILLLLSDKENFLVKRTRIQRGITLVFLLASLLMTGRRAPTLFMLIALAGIYILPQKGASLLRRISKVLLLSFVALLIAFLFMDRLVGLPFFARISESLNAFLSGQDISSGRSALFSHAWSTFLANPFFGIGWGNFRTTTIGQVTIMTQMDVHNIYLQLLCETGFVGFMLIMTAFMVTLGSTLKSVRGLQSESRGGAWLSLLRYSLGYQLFFLLYGLTGNPLYEPIFLMMYFFSSAIVLAYRRYDGIRSGERVMVAQRSYDPKAWDA